MPKTLQGASELIRSLIHTDDKATQEQIKYIKQRNMAPGIDISRLTKAQARVIISRFLRRSNNRQQTQPVQDRRSARDSQKKPPPPDAEDASDDQQE